MEINDRIMELIAVGASITANCQPCLKSHVDKALTFGACPEEIAAAEIGNRVRKGAGVKMKAFCSNLQAASLQRREVPSWRATVTGFWGRNKFGSVKREVLP